MRLSEKPPALSADDWITVGVTHNIKIDGDDAWPKVEMGSKVRPGETPDEAFNRVSDFVNDKAIEMAEKTAQKVMERNK